MEINITEFIRNECFSDYSASAAEIGDHAGELTWQSAMNSTEPYSHWLDTEEKREEFRKFVKDSGGWSWEEIKAWSDKELLALLIQWIAGDIRESEIDGIEISLDMTDEDWKQIEEWQEQGIIPSRLFRTEENQFYFYIGY